MESQHSYSIESAAQPSNTNNSKQMSQRLEHYRLSIPVCPDPWNPLKVTLRLARALCNFCEGYLLQSHKYLLWIFSINLQNELG